MSSAAQWRLAVLLMMQVECLPCTSHNKYSALHAMRVLLGTCTECQISAGYSAT